MYPDQREVFHQPDDPVFSAEPESPQLTDRRSQRDREAAAAALHRRLEHSVEEDFTEEYDDNRYVDDSIDLTQYDERVRGDSF